MGSLREPVNEKGFVKAVCPDWFVDCTVFTSEALLRPVAFNVKFPDLITARGILLWMAAGGLEGVGACPYCRKMTELRCVSDGGSRGVRWCWACPV